ncbi:hypothetical protein MED121_01305 [Marinomonas sp. MED121]|nr:hypothetical protein MED121_01305 [Marinomonas sp. MED121]
MQIIHSLYGFYFFLALYSLAMFSFKEGQVL